jgi:hypothetical protein
MQERNEIMKTFGTLMKVLIAGVAIFIFQTIASAIVPVNVTMPPHTLPWLIVANFMTAATLVLVASRSEWRGWRLGVAISTIPIVLGLINMIEGAIFLTNSGIDWPSFMADTVITYELAVPLWILLFAKRGESTGETYHPVDSRPSSERLWKFAACDVSYPVLYFLAGTIIFPFVRDFYASQTLPPAGRLIAMQLLVRGPILVGLCLLLLRLLRLPRVSGALAVGVVLALLNGVAPLLIPNPYLPDVVRWAHLFEIAGSNFVFGGIVGWLWGRSGSVARTLSKSQAA